ncbi:hypothetical protein F2P81_005467 [Scophthalmus maximus]|uniref:MOB kinase activator 3A n=1 Tax=Scophthalmus maximus TaxID=52904 RepID=A0A6A4T9Q9_SCOMX|nr:hypothetical protein F2P81_005467 [Scophthalmus maximus]
MSMALKQVFNKDRTFRPKRKFEPGTQRFELHKKAQASLNAGLDLKQAVQLPHGEDLNDWVAVHVVDFFNRINLIYGTISDSCTDQTCPVMSGGPKYEYRWQDEHKYKRPTALSAPKYMSLLMDWIEVQVNNENIFPTNVGTPFPKTFMQVAKKILSRLFRVFVHVYIHHFDRVSQMGAEAHVNTCYKHFYYFVTEFNLTDHKELEPLDFVSHLRKKHNCDACGCKSPVSKAMQRGCGYPIRVNDLTKQIMQENRPDCAVMKTEGAFVFREPGSPGSATAVMKKARGQHCRSDFEAVIRHNGLDYVVNEH